MLISPVILTQTFGAHLCVPRVEQAFVGFTEPVYDFSPTFKVARHSGFVYNE